MCKKCKKAFRKDMANYEESDEFCPHCDNHYVSVLLRTALIESLNYGFQVIDAKTPQAVLGVEGDDPRINARSVSHGKTL